MTSTSTERQRISAERERQRFLHLVLGRARPIPQIGPKPKGLSKSEWRARKDALRAQGATLAPGIEERVQLVEAFGHRQGTPETLASLEHRQRRPGAIARLYTSRAIDADQLAAADKIATTYQAVIADVRFRTASWETRCGGGGGGSGEAEGPPLAAALGGYALEWWLSTIRQPEAMLAIVAQDVGLTIAAERYALSVPRTRKLVGEALTHWWNRFGRGDVVSL